LLADIDDRDGRLVANAAQHARFRPLSAATEPPSVASSQFSTASPGTR
jgi:hypothetical protein